jgi:hypothetical protein
MSLFKYHPERPAAADSDWFPPAVNLANPDFLPAGERRWLDPPVIVWTTMGGSMFLMLRMR